MLKVNNFSDAIKIAFSRFSDKTIATDTWQGMKIQGRKDLEMHEVLNFSFETLPPVKSDNLNYYRKDIAPNLPWADDHFEERVGGQPLNPGVQWAKWPYAKSADTFREGGKFNHNYMERLWPRYAGQTEGGILKPKEKLRPNSGIYFEYGDLQDVVKLISEDSYTRQAYLPLFFPEDTGNRNPGRKPCTLGYHFIFRENRLNCTYYMRSCDFLRHFRDDLYMAVRLQLWVLDELAKVDRKWEDVYPGTFTFHCTSLHLFRNDYLLLKKEGK